MGRADGAAHRASVTLLQLSINISQHQPTSAPMRTFGQRRRIIRSGRYTSRNIRLAARDVPVLIIRLRIV